MSRHRDVRSMNYTDEYDGYDDVYGHSVEDDYCVSPSAEQFMFDRNKSANMSSFFTEPDILEANEEEEEVAVPSSYKLPELTDLEAAKLMSCVEAVKNVIGETLPESELNKKIIEFNYNTEAVLNSILNDETRSNKDKQPAEKDLVEAQSGKRRGGAAAAKVVPQLMMPPVKVVPSASKTIVKGFDVSAENVDLLRSPRTQSPSSERSSPDPSSRDTSLRKESKKQQASGGSVIGKSSSSRSESPMASDSESQVEVRVKPEEKRDALVVYKNKREGCKEQLHLIVVGHVDAGKSTLLGRMLCDLGQVSAKLIHKYQQESKKIGKQSFAYAWVLDETGEERERGITMDVGHSKFETNTKSVTLLDAPGHRDFIPNMIMVDWSKERYNEIVNKLGAFLKQAGFRDSVTYVPCSGLSGENIVSKPESEGLSSWYTGPTLIQVIDNFKCPERPVDKPFRFSVNDVFKNIGSGFSVFGHMETGMVSVGDKVLILPRNEPAVVKGIQIDEANTSHAFAGDQASLILSGIDQQNLAIGDIVCSPLNPVPVSSCFQAHVVIFAVKTPLTNGMPVVLHQQSLVEPAVISKLVAQLNRSTGEVIKKKPRCLLKNSSAIVEITTQRPICVELHKEVKQLGRVMLRIDGATVAAGLVTKIK
ncbi:hypothetical protein TSAR_004780 [Trichomalopsis sarcophagae]|uniref:Tr-type G domain-containing protein n=1 Tax=Trichomalopsis sarcophagae TaxID=543379 RepID=A0A232FDK9_9HYME|nr:hypothetical protein TSAR_004780 [Trichomalopsis sarcophagae]